MLQRQHAAANKQHSPIVRKLSRCLQQTRLVCSFPASTYASLQAVSVAFACAIGTGHMPAKERKWQSQWACALSSCWHAESELTCIAGAAQQKPEQQAQRVSIRIYCISLSIWSDIAVSKCVMPVIPTTILGWKGPVLWTKQIQADITMNGSLNLDVVFKCNQRPLSTFVSSCN